MTRLRWVVVRVEKIERVTSLGYGFGSKEEAALFAKDYIQDNPDEPMDDIFILEDMNEPLDRISVAALLKEQE